MASEQLELLPVGTRIRFKERITVEACGDHPSLLYAPKGALGRVVAHGSHWRHHVTWDGNPGTFGCADHEIEGVKDE